MGYDEQEYQNQQGHQKQQGYEGSPDAEGHGDYYDWARAAAAGEMAELWALIGEIQRHGPNAPGVRQRYLTDMGAGDFEAGDVIYSVSFLGGNFEGSLYSMHFLRSDDLVVAIDREAMGDGWVKNIVYTCPTTAIKDYMVEFKRLLMEANNRPVLKGYYLDNYTVLKKRDGSKHLLVTPYDGYI